MVGHCADSEKKYIRNRPPEENILVVKGLSQKKGIVYFWHSAGCRRFFEPPKRKPISYEQWQSDYTGNIH
jgi:hypothetical protein